MFESWNKSPKSPISPQPKSDLADLLREMVAQNQSQQHQGLQNSVGGSVSMSGGRAGAGPAEKAARHTLTAVAVLKADRAVKQVIANIPFAVANKVVAVKLSRTDVPMNERWFEVSYVNGRVTRFDNIDTFPTEADIVRICFEAP